jgi:hypothetical protein
VTIVASDSIASRTAARSAVAAAIVATASGALSVAGYLGVVIASLGLLSTAGRDLYVDLLVLAVASATLSWVLLLFSGAGGLQHEHKVLIAKLTAFGVVGAAMPVLLNVLQT